MAVTTFAAIDISSYEITMKIFEFSEKRQLSDGGRYPVSSESWSRGVFRRDHGGRQGRYHL